MGQWDKVTRTCKSFSNFEESLRIRMLVVCLLLTGVFGLPAKKEKRERRLKQGTSSCTREVCARARSTLKVNGDCVKTPFCVRALLKDLKKATKEKQRLLKSSDKERKCISKPVEEVSSRTVPPPRVLAQFNSLMVEHEAMVEKNKELSRQNKELLEQVESLS